MAGAFATVLRAALFVAALVELADALVAVFLATALAGAFLAPLVIALNSAPGRNAGTDVFFTRTAAPVAGLRAIRAARSRRSKMPKPVRVTRSPLAT